MSLWIQIDTQRSSNRKTYGLAELLSQGARDLFGGRDDVAWLAIAIAVLDDFWSWVAEHHPDGEVTDAHPTSLRKPLLQWLHGTEWATRDVRDLLVKSGHIDRRPDGRFFVHDWLEWTGGSVLKLAKDRKRKRLARAKGGRTRLRTRERKPSGQSDPGPALAGQSSAVPSSPVPSVEQQQQSAASPSSVPTLPYATRCVIAVNQELERLLAGAYRTLVAAVEAPVAEAWARDGIPIELAETTCRERAAAFRSTPHNRQPHTLRYFDAAVREAAAKIQASTAPRPRQEFERLQDLAAAERARAEASS